MSEEQRKQLLTEICEKLSEHSVELGMTAEHWAAFAETVNMTFSDADIVNG